MNQMVNLLLINFAAVNKFDESIPSMYPAGNIDRSAIPSVGHADDGDSEVPLGMHAHVGHRAEFLEKEVIIDNNIIGVPSVLRTGEESLRAAKAPAPPVALVIAYEITQLLHILMVIGGGSYTNDDDIQTLL